MRPRSVAVVGVSGRSTGFGSVGVGFVRAMLNLGHERVYPVNPKYEEIEGIPCYKSILDIADDLDHVISCVSASLVPDLLDQCIQKGVRSLHLFTAGFKETGDEDAARAEEDLVKKARAAGIRLIGPNSMGLYVPSACLSFNAGFPREPGDVAFISQSGGNAIDTVLMSTSRGVRFSSVISYGNGADVNDVDLLEYLASDPATRIVGGYVEGVGSGRELLGAMKKVTASKPLVVLKGGASNAGTRTALSHTGAIAGSQDIFKAACRQVNAVLVTSLDELVDVLVAFRFLDDLQGSGVCAVGGGGGFSIFAADEIEGAGLRCPPMPEHAQDRLREMGSEAGSILDNPVDTIERLDPEKLEKILRIVGDVDGIDITFVTYNVSVGPGRSAPEAYGMTPEDYHAAMVEAMTRARAATGKPIVAVIRPPWDVESMKTTTYLRDRCSEAGFATFESVPRAANAVAQLLRWREGRE